MDFKVETTEVVVNAQVPVKVDVLEQVVTVIEVSKVEQGPPGPPGKDGTGSGGAAQRYEHVQSIAADTWTVNHNLGVRPHITIQSVGGVLMLAEVIHTSANQALVYFDQPQAGLATCS